MAEVAFDFEGEDDDTRNRFAASTQEPMSQSPRYSPSLSSVYEFPLNSNVDRTIEIGSSGEELSCMDELPSDSDEGSEGFTFPSEDDGDDSCSSDDGVLFLSDTENDSDTTSISQGKSRSATENVDDVQSELRDVGTTLVSGCCQQQCLLSLTPKAVLSARRRLNSLSSIDKKQWITDKVLECSTTSNPSPGNASKLQTHLFFSGTIICKGAWCKIHQLSERQLQRVSRNVASGFTKVSHGNAGRKRTNAKSEIAKTWMERYFHLIGDKMPHNEQIHLPSWETQKDVYTRYSSDMSSQQITSDDTVCLSTFYKIWSDNFPKVVIPEVREILAHLQQNDYAHAHRI